eukprot:TRINITY_DN3363_c0_g1_i1.p1 TRINITY_DN3363_c0_g1~~TRINITY_DN3363_c0_g1_i1.p1  ORF type:complete len:239 (-),score=22.43 TRINITY_DN3363_c0_g1_i1:245-961(-)
MFDYAVLQRLASATPMLPMVDSETPFQETLCSILNAAATVSQAERVSLFVLDNALNYTTKETEQVHIDNGKAKNTLVLRLAITQDKTSSKIFQHNIRSYCNHMIRTVAKDDAEFQEDSFSEDEMSPLESTEKTSPIGHTRKNGNRTWSNILKSPFFFMNDTQSSKHRKDNTIMNKVALMGHTFHLTDVEKLNKEDKDLENMIQSFHVNKSPLHSLFCVPVKTNNGKIVAVLRFANCKR